MQPQWKNVHRPSINNSLSVAFGAIPASGPNSWNTVIRADGAIFTTIAEPGLSAPGAGTILNAFEPALNNAGQVEFQVNTVEGVSGIFRGSGGTLTKIVTSAGSAFSGINDAGRVAFASGNFVKSGTGGTLTTIAACRGPGRDLGRLPLPARRVPRVLLRPIADARRRAPPDARADPRPRRGGRAWPCAQLPVGAAVARTSIEAAGVSDDNTETAFMLQPGVGLTFIGGDGWGVFGQVDYRRILRRAGRHRRQRQQPVPRVLRLPHDPRLTSILEETLRPARGLHRERVRSAQSSVLDSSPEQHLGLPNASITCQALAQRALNRRGEQ